MAARETGSKKTKEKKMLTIKYRTYVRVVDPANGDSFTAHEQIHTGFDMTSQEIEGGNMVVHAHRGGDPGMMFGPWLPPEPEVAGQSSVPRPIVWVMNEQGATVGRYDL